MGKNFDVIVVGIGTMGSATCFELAQRGLRVLGIEQSGIPNPLAAHSGHGRVLRLSYREHDGYVEMVRRAIGRWRELETDSGRRLMTQTGILLIAAPGDPVLDGSVRSAEKHGLRYELLDHTTLAERYPQLRLPPDFRNEI